MLPVLWPQLTPGHYAFISHLASASLTGPPGVRHNSFAAQPPDLLLRSYVYLSGFGLLSTLAHRLALYPVSVRRLLGFATPLPPPLTLLSAACGSLHLAVTTRGGTFTRKNCAMPGTLNKKSEPSAYRLKVRISHVWWSGWDSNSILDVYWLILNDSQFLQALIFQGFHAIS